jgi:hypothetical protein
VNGEGGSDYGGGEQPTTGEEDGARACDGGGGAGGEGEQAAAAVCGDGVTGPEEEAFGAVGEFLGCCFWFSGVPLRVSLQEFCSVEALLPQFHVYGTIVVFW